MAHLGLGMKEINGEIQDVYLDSLGNLTLVKDAEAVGQHAKQRMMTFLGEWYLDEDVGTPWVERIFAQQYDPAMAEVVIKTVILDTDGVEEITSFSVSFSQKIRKLKANSIRVLTQYDEETTL